MSTSSAILHNDVSHHSDITSVQEVMFSQDILAMQTFPQEGMVAFPFYYNGRRVTKEALKRASKERICD